MVRSFSSPIVGVGLRSQNDPLGHHSERSTLGNRIEPTLGGIADLGSSAFAIDRLSACGSQQFRSLLPFRRTV